MCRETYLAPNPLTPKPIWHSSNSPKSYEEGKKTQNHDSRQDPQSQKPNTPIKIARRFVNEPMLPPSLSIARVEECTASFLPLEHFRLVLKIGSGVSDSGSTHRLLSSFFVV